MRSEKRCSVHLDTPPQTHTRGKHRTPSSRYRESERRASPVYDPPNTLSISPLTKTAVLASTGTPIRPRACSLGRCGEVPSHPLPATQIAHRTSKLNVHWAIDTSDHCAQLLQFSPLTKGFFGPSSRRGALLCLLRSSHLDPIFHPLPHTSHIAHRTSHIAHRSHTTHRKTSECRLRIHTNHHGARTATTWPALSLGIDRDAGLGLEPASWSS